MKPCKKEITVYPAWKVKNPKVIDFEQLSKEERFKFLADMIIETKSEPIKLTRFVS